MSAAATLQPPGVVCVCVRRHSPEPVVLEHHHIWPQEYDGPTIPENLVWICATTHNTVHRYIQSFMAAGRVMSVPDLRKYLKAAKYPGVVSPYAYDLALTGYRRIQTQSL